MWTAEIVRARFIEAADVERRMLVKGGPASGGASWPSYSYEFEDMAGWDDQAITDNLERWQGRKVTKSPELTRWEEVFFDWTKIVPERHRVLVWRWSQCIASGRSFVAWCERKGINRSTAYNRLERIWENLATQFRKEGRMLLDPDEKWTGQQEPLQAPSAGKMTKVARDKDGGHLPYRSERSHDTLTTPQAIAEFTEHLAKTNEERRKARLRKALRGVPGEQEAA